MGPTQFTIMMDLIINRMIVDWYTLDQLDTLGTFFRFFGYLVGLKTLYDTDE